MDKNISLSNTGQMQQVIHVSWIEVEISVMQPTAPSKIQGISNHNYKLNDLQI